VLHTFLVSHLRLVLDVQLSTGKQHTSGYAKAALGRLLDELGEKRPALVRGDSGYGNEGILLELESRAQPYLLRLRQTANVQRLVAMAFTRTDWSHPDSQGCQMIGSEVRLHGWSKSRRVVIGASASRAASRGSGASTAGSCSSICSRRSSKPASGCGSTRCWSPTWLIRSRPWRSCTATGPMQRTPSTS
jgi:hypothetical protein